MSGTAQLHGRPLKVTLSRAAERRLRESGAPLLVELELYFSCLIRKRVRFHPGLTHPDAATLGDGLSIRFRPVMTRACGLDYEGEEPPLTDFPLERPERFVPHWVTIDWHGGAWHGEFGY